ncbi:Protein CBG22111 [Caenorhabditis briggsae]|uniref:Protein CBG22111 n=1 Tax=Caenorhabditis briggsae TaxID=6238 RepID=A8Y1J6_CAEBR|nr:Protein CBG22111 [Caenorhabditis briggsae]CAP38766.2 Protein CBG22111 [Caenorhabditis briggsae]
MFQDSEIPRFQDSRIPGFQNSLIWKADLSGGSNGDRNVSMEFKNAPSAALSTFSQILKIGTNGFNGFSGGCRWTSAGNFRELDCFL